MPWTIEDKLEWLLRQPWRVLVEREDDGSYFARIDGLSGAVAHGQTPKELEHEFWESARETFRAYLEAGEMMSLPNNASAPWTTPQREVRGIKARLIGGASLLADSLTSLGGGPVPA